MAMTASVARRAAQADAAAHYHYFFLFKENKGAALGDARRDGNSGEARRLRAPARLRWRL